MASISPGDCTATRLGTTRIPDNVKSEALQGFEGVLQSSDVRRCGRIAAYAAGLGRSEDCRAQYAVGC